MRNVSTRFGAHVVHAGLNLEIRRAEVFALIGGSGSGKSTLLREKILLQRPDHGDIRILGENLATLDDAAARRLRLRCGVMFQHGGLFGSLTIGENVGLPLREHAHLPDELVDHIAQAKLAITGLGPEVWGLFPAELSGGMMKRAALARALALDPELLFLDEPTAGLDPAGADGIDTLIVELREMFDLTVVIISHDLDLLWQIATRVAVLGSGTVQGVGSMEELAGTAVPAIRPFFDGRRARAARVPQAAREAPSIPG